MVRLVCCGASTCCILEAVWIWLYSNVRYSYHASILAAAVGCNR